MSLREADAPIAEGGAAVAPVILDLCTVCHANPRAGSGLLSRCLACIRKAAERDRQDRIEAEAALAARRAELQKPCLTCKKTLALADFSPRRLAKDGRRKSCKSCCRAGKIKPKTRSAEQRERARLAAQQPERRARNLAAVIAWQQRNPQARQAHKAVEKAVKAGEIVPGKVCMAVGCKRRTGLVLHHNSYASNRRKRTIRLCGPCHSRCHSGRSVPLKKSAPVRFARAPRTA